MHYRAFPLVRCLTAQLGLPQIMVAGMDDLRDVLGIRVPVLQAPMAAGPVGPELVAAVSRAGGLGMLGVMGMTRDAVAADVRRALELGATAVAVNVQLARAAPGEGRPEDVAGVLAPFHAELGI